MRKRLLPSAVLLLLAMQGWAQEPTTSETEKAIKDEANSFIFTESQLDDDADVTQDVIQINSSTNMYTSNVGYLFSPMRFKFRALDQKYNDIYMNGVNVNSAENGRFSYSTIGGMNDATRGIDYASPFESNTFSMAALGGSNDYNFRASNYAAGHKVTLSALNRNYTARAMYTFGTGLNEHGLAFFGTVGYRWANTETAAVEGTFYNSLAYFLSLQKKWGERHSLNIATWGNPTERAQQGASTDEAYWLANNYLYNPNWGYQDGKKRNSRVVHNYEPSLLLTWDFDINDRLKLTTSLYSKYAMYSGTRLQYNNSQNPKPDYWKNFPSYNYDVWGLTDGSNNDLAAWQESYDYWTAAKANRQIQWDRLYYANQQMNAVKGDAAYYVAARHNDQLSINLGSTLNWTINNRAKLQGGLQLASNTGMHYQTIDDMMGAEYLHNVNNYAIGTYTGTDPRVQYDLNKPNGTVTKGDRFGYDFNIVVQKATAWAQYVYDYGVSHSFISGKIGGTQMWRDGKMRNGLFADNSYGKSGTARFLDGGVKIGSNINLGKGNVIGFGVGYMTYAPTAYSSFGGSAFQAAEMNNNFIDGLKVEHMVSAELGYAVATSWMRANLTAYFNHGTRMNEWQNYYYDDVNSFTYVSMTGVEKNFYGVELGIRFNVATGLTLDLIGSMSDAKYMKNTDVSYLLSTQGTVTKDILYNKGMREASTPLTVGSIGLNYNIKGWYLNLKGNYYDRIYLSYSPSLRYQSTLVRSGAVDNDGSLIVPEQTKGHGGFMLDGSIGHQFRVAHHPLSVNLMLTNILNNRKFVSGGFEQSRSSYTTDQTTGEKSTIRTYNFQKNPMKYYVQGFNFMLNLNYRF
ncbi:MAG: TonB-dependent receptor [Bacteroidaceae bacterium]|nr:TonB-dependent receptor [Bacteroidaceae bacterium]